MPGVRATTSSWPARTSTPSRPSGHQRQRHGSAALLEVAEQARQRSRAEHGAAGLVGRRRRATSSARPSTSNRLTLRAAARHRAVPELRHDRLAELRLLHLRRRRLRRRRARAPARSARRRSRSCSRLLRRARACRPRAPTSTGAPTTGRSSPSASRPAACSPGPRGSRRPQAGRHWGGTAGHAYDPCYHQACDTFANNNDRPSTQQRRHGLRRDHLRDEHRVHQRRSLRKGRPIERRRRATASDSRRSLRPPAFVRAARPAPLTIRAGFRLR